jgi:hypothetical protein
MRKVIAMDKKIFSGWLFELKLLPRQEAVAKVILISLLVSVVSKTNMLPQVFCSVAAFYFGCWVVEKEKKESDQDG